MELSEEQKKHAKLAGVIVAVVGSIAASLGYFSTDSFKEGFCEGYVKPVPSPLPVPAPVISVIPLASPVAK